MADFVQKSVVKSSTRKLSAPIEDLTAFTTLVDEIISENPWGCTAYQSAGVNKPAVEKTTEYYSGKVIYENNEAKVVGTISIKAPTPAAFNTNRTTIMGTAALATAMGGTASHDSSEDSFSCTIKGHYSNGELFSVTFKRDSVTVSSYEADAIVTTIETWADTVAILA